MTAAGVTHGTIAPWIDAPLTRSRAPKSRSTKSPRFWDDLRQLFARHNEQLVARHLPRIKQKGLAEHVTVNAKTFNGWWKNDIVPAEFVVLAQVAELLGGDYEVWLDRSQPAHAAYERLPPKASVPDVSAPLRTVKHHRLMCRRSRCS